MGCQLTVLDAHIDANEPLDYGGRHSHCDIEDLLVAAPIVISKMFFRSEAYNGLFSDWR